MLEEIHECAHRGTRSIRKYKQPLPASALNQCFASYSIWHMYFRRLSEVPSHRKLLVSSVPSKLDKTGLSGERAILLMLRNHQSRQEKLLLVVRVARKQKERKF